MLLRLALLNLSRNLRRTILSLGSVIAGVGVLILGRGFIAGIEENITRTQVDTISAHLMLRPAGYPTEGFQHPLDDLLVVDDALRASLDETGGRWTPRLLFTPRAVKGVDALRVRAVGFDPATDADVFPRRDWTVEGAIPATAEDGLLVGAGLARLLEVAPGDRLVLQVRTRAGALNALDVPVSGIVRVNSPMIDRLGVLMTMDLAQDLVRAEGAVSHLAVRLRDRDAAFDAAAALSTRTGEGTEAVSWYDEVKDLLRVQQIRRRALDFLVFALMGMSAAGIANTILMAAYERVREIGTLRAMGMTEGRVVQLFLLEGALMGVAGSALGAGLGSAAIVYWSWRGIDLSGAMEEVATNVPFSAILYTRFDEGSVVTAVVFGIVVSVLASLLPARVASRMAPADAVRA